MSEPLAAHVPGLADRLWRAYSAVPVDLRRHVEFVLPEAWAIGLWEDMVKPRPGVKEDYPDWWESGVMPRDGHRLFGQPAIVEKDLDRALIRYPI